MTLKMGNISDSDLERSEVAKVLASPLFSHSPRLSRFLRFVADEALAGRQERIKETVIGVEVFDKDPTYDPRTDPTVRTEASKLRTKLRAYYEEEGRNDPLMITIPKGGYVPVFEVRPDHVAPAGTPARPPLLRPRLAALAAVVILAAAVASIVGLGRSAKPSRAGRRTPRNQDAYRFYLKGEGHALNGTLTDLRYAIQYLNLAIAADPDYAIARATLSLTYAKLLDTETVAAAELLPQLKTQAQEALRLDESLAEGHDAMAHALLIADYDWERADREFQRAISIDPSYTNARVAYARICLNPRGLHDEAARQLQAGLARDPLAGYLITELAVTDVRRGRIDQGIDRIRQNLVRYPNGPGTLTHLAIALQLKSQYNEAVPYLLRARELAPENVWVASQLAICRLRLGQRAEAQAILNELTTRSGVPSIPYYSAATIYAALGERDAAFEHLERAWSLRLMQLLWLKVDPRLEPLRSDPRFAGLLARVHLAESKY